MVAVQAEVHMNYDSFMKQLKQGTLNKNFLLLFGEEVHLKAHGKKELLKQISPEQMPEFNIFEFEGKKYDLKDVDDAIEALPVMSDTKLLIFHNSMIFTASGSQSATQEYKQYWEKRLSDIPEHVYILFDEEKIDKRNSLYKKLLSEDAVVEFSYFSEEKMIRWTVQLFHTFGKTISPQNAKYLIEITENGMTAVKREAEKLAAYTQDRERIAKADIDAVVVPVIENRVFEMVDAILSKNLTVALARLNDLITLKEETVKIFVAISSSVEKILTVKLMAEQKMDRAQIIEKSGIAPFLVSKYLTLSAKYTRETIADLLTLCVSTDEKFKLSKGEKTSILQRFIIDFAG